MSLYLDPEKKQKLKERAERNRRSLAAEVITMLERVMAEDEAKESKKK